MKQTEKILYLEKRGCDFIKDEPASSVSDVNNYRVGSYDYSIKGKNGRSYILEFSLWRNRGHYRYISKYGNRPLKKPVFEVDELSALALSTEYEDKDGSWRDSKLEKIIHKKPMKYTQENILKVVNYISKDHYTKIIFQD